MIFLFLFVLAVFLIFFPVFRCMLAHPVSLTVYAFRDVYYYIRHRDYNFCGTGELVAYVGLFGRGKTLSAVHRVVSTYNQFDGKPVWCPRRRKVVTQRVQVISNVALKIPYEEFVSLEQIVLAAERKQKYDDEHDTLTVTLVLGDEFSVQMNSRNFKTNINPLFLNTVLTCRHYYISLFYTAQRFNHVDALLRQVTGYVVDCNKLWRFQRLNAYDAWDLENASSVQMVTPFARSCWFVKDADYEAYDTLACVGNLKHEMQAGNMMSEEEILKLQQNTHQVNMDGVKNPRRRWPGNRK